MNGMNTVGLPTRKGRRACLLTLVATLFFVLSACGGHDEGVSNNNAAASMGTFTMWVRSHWEGGNNAGLARFGSGTFENRIDLFKNGPYLRFLLVDNSGLEGGLGIDVSDWHDGDRRMLTVTWGEGVCALYLDGALAADGRYSDQIMLGPEAAVFVGPQPLNIADISDFRHYLHPLSADEVAMLFAQPPS